MVWCGRANVAMFDPFFGLTPQIAARVHLGSYHTAKANLHAWMRRGKKGQVS